MSNHLNRKGGGAELTARFANRTSPEIMNRTLGFGLTALSMAMITIKLI